MAHVSHTYGPLCQLSRDPMTTPSEGDDGLVIPIPMAQFFYNSPLHIDDPLAVVPQPAESAKAMKGPPIPFSAYDNAALEDSWLRLCRHDSGTAFEKLNSSSAIDELVGVPSSSLDEAPALRKLDDFDESASDDSFETSHSFIDDSSDILADVRGRTELELSGKSYARCWNKHDKTTEDVEVPVGISRLHAVKLPTLLMRPIYWTPVGDIAVVTRATWFYKDTMYPVDPAVANQLEAGYRIIQPWSQTWSDKLMLLPEKGEETLYYRLWPSEVKLPSSAGDANEAGDKADIGSTCPAFDPRCAATCFHGEVASTGNLKTALSVDGPPPSKPAKQYPNSNVIYKDDKNAFILNQTFPSFPMYGRKPLDNMMRGTPIGIHVTRGFESDIWQKLYLNKGSSTPVQSLQTPLTSNTIDPKEGACPSCRQQEEQTEFSDLVLVVHGIGQKLSETVESFHFTHAVNSFRRLVNVDMGNESVRSVLREDCGQFMVLPVNWRSKLSLDDRPGEDELGESTFKLSLKDITPPTIPAVRNAVSDIFLDIPYYMSSHKLAMLDALVTDANRIYNLWCSNHPGFGERGRVHIVAHSLGSAMAMEILSKQPTDIEGPDVQEKIPDQYLHFNVKNLFLIGSPAAFFLYLERGQLTPRNGRQNAGLAHAETGKAGKAEDFDRTGQLGSLAVENLYNIMQPNDPIAYALNAGVDPFYARLLQTAFVPSISPQWSLPFVPSATPAWALSTAMRGLAPFSPSSLTPFPVEVAPALDPLSADVPPTPEQAAAENTMYLFNDNGQIDYYLTPVGGPPEVQYLTMLGAHTIYWTHPDFIRLLVTEIGRRPGRENTFANMRAVKK